MMGGGADPSDRERAHSRRQVHRKADVEDIRGRILLQISGWLGFGQGLQIGLICARIARKVNKRTRRSRPGSFVFCKFPLSEGYYFVSRLRASETRNQSTPDCKSGWAVFFAGFRFPGDTVIA